MKKYILLMIAMAGVAGLFAQQQKRNNNWHFGYHAGLSFNNNTVTVINSAYDGNVYESSEAFSDMSDTSGQVLFYTNGKFVFNRLDEVMPNGSGLAADNSSTQGALIVPVPGNPNLFYIFTSDLQAGPKGFCYSIVDMTLDNGKGDVTTKNVKLLNTVAEKGCAVSSADGGYWVMTHEWPGDGFYAYKVTSTGLNTTPVITHTGTVHNDVTLNNTNGQMKFSPDGKKLAVCINYQSTTDLLDFDNATGIVSNPISLTGNQESYATEFSPGSKILYIAHNTPTDYVLAQYDLTLPTGTDIINSRTEVGRDAGQFRQLQLAPNNKIYMARNSQNPYLSVINDPDSLGVACNFVINEIDLDPGFTGLVWAELGLPNQVKYISVASVEANFQTIDTFICPGTCVNFTDLSLNNPTSWQWRFVFANPDTSTEQNPQNICFPSPGNYTVILIVGNAGGFDTVRINDAVKVYPIPSISITVQGDTFTVFDGVSWQWYKDGEMIEGATGQVYVADGPGSYSVSIIDQHGCTTSSSPIVVAGISELDAEQVKIYPNPVSTGNWQLKVGTGLIGSTARVYDDNGRLVWHATISSFKTDIPVSGIAQGIYWLRISNNGDELTRKLVRM